MISANWLLKSWLSYRYGIFSEVGFGSDNNYPWSFLSGNQSERNVGCGNPEKDLAVCKLGDLYNREAPTKQNILCYGVSALETVLKHEDFQVSFLFLFENCC